MNHQIKSCQKKLAVNFFSEAVGCSTTGGAEGVSPPVVLLGGRGFCWWFPTIFFFSVSLKQFLFLLLPFPHKAKGNQVSAFGFGYPRYSARLVTHIVIRIMTSGLFFI